MSDITLSTDADQTPIAPGNQVSDVTEGRARTARFVSPAPILNFFSIQSADYKVATREHNGIKLSVYYHAGHDWNVHKMLNAMGAALDYYRAHYGPYQFNYARIIEFPGYSSFAQAFAGTMPYSESIGFNANTDDPTKIDFTTYVVAHEMSHQYWAHQVIGADMQGGTISSETLAQYSALMVMKHLYGPDKIRRFLKYELKLFPEPRQRGRRGTAARARREPAIHPLQQGLSRHVSASRALGEDAVDRALARFDAPVQVQGRAYPRSVDLIDEFRKEAKTPRTAAADHRPVREDHALRSQGHRRRDAKGFHRWTTTLTLAADKYYANGKGVETKALLKEPIEIGLFTARPGLGAFSAKDVIAFERKPIHSGTAEGYDPHVSKARIRGRRPYNFYVDRNSDDNVKDVTAS